MIMVRDENKMAYREITVEYMREKRRTAETGYIKFVEARQYHKTHAFCFYEGEDGKYYNMRIARAFGDQFISFVAGNKNEVIKLMHKIKSSGIYTDVCLMFFVDRDFGPSLVDTDEDLFETPCYSVENFYTGEQTFCNILQAEFGLNISEADYGKCIEAYKRGLKEFCRLMIDFNSLVCYQHWCCPCTVYRFNQIKTSQLVELRDGKVEWAPRYEEKIEGIKAALHPDEKIMERIKTELSKVEDPNQVFRGKNQLDFLTQMVKYFKEQNRKGGYFSEKHDTVHINISENRLSELSQYAMTPPELTAFVAAHYEKYFAPIPA